MKNRRDHPVGFPSTHWSVVDGVHAPESEARRTVIEQLVLAYLPALESHLIRRPGMRREEAHELVQGFITEKILERNLIAQADKGKGRFRSFILTCLDRYVIDHSRRQVHAVRAVPLDPEASRSEEIDNLGGQVEPVDAFDVAWAREVLLQAVSRVRQEYEAKSREDLWGIFDACLTGPLLRGIDSTPYSELVVRYGLESPVHAGRLLQTGKRAFLRALNEVVSEYQPDAVEEEIAELRETLLRCGVGPPTEGEA